MINKQKLWFLTLFSIILVLSVYYVSIPNENLSNLIKSNGVTSDKTTIKTNSEDNLAALRVSNDEEVLAEMTKLQETLLDTTASSEDKNNAYEKLLSINLTKGKEATLEELVLKEFKIKSFIKINGDKISITIPTKDGSYEKANQIMRLIQKEFDKKQYITVKYQ